ncbi:MAG TPA: hypothetical protein VLH10_23415 [Yinghuangia sp.]|nr:hypothetical protein [Yinghuangia sp.]
MRLFDTGRAPEAEEATRLLTAAESMVLAGKSESGRKRYERLAQRLDGVAGLEDLRGRALAGAAAATAQLGDGSGALARYREAFWLLNRPTSVLPEWALRHLAHEQVVAEQPALAPVLAFLAVESTHPLAAAMTEWVQQWCRSGDDTVTGAVVTALPRTEWAVLARASALRRAKRLGEAAELLAAAACPPTDQVAFAHGVVLLTLGRHHAAVDAFTLAHGRPRSPHRHPWSRGPQLPGEALLYRAMSRDAAGDAAGAGADLAAAAEILPDDPRVLYALGAAALREGRDGEAQPRFEAVLAADPHHAGAHLGLGLVYERTDRPVEAAAAYRSAGPVTPRVRVRLACVLTAAGLPEQAVALWSDAPVPGADRTRWDDAEPVREDAFHLAAAYFAAGDHERAARLWGLSVPGNAALVWDHQARGALAAGRVDEARALWRRCVASGGKAVLYRRPLGEASFRAATHALVARDAGAAEEALREVASLLGDEVRVRSAQGALALLQGRAGDAASLLAAIKGRPRDRYHLAVARLADARPARTLALLDADSDDLAAVRLRAVLAFRAGNWTAAYEGFRLCLRALRPKVERDYVVIPAGPRTGAADASDGLTAPAGTSGVRRPGGLTEADSPECGICGRVHAAPGPCGTCGAAVLEAAVAAARGAGVHPGLLLTGWEGTALHAEASRLRALLLAEEGEIDAALALLEPGNAARAPLVTRRAAEPGRSQADVLADLREAAGLPDHHPGVDTALAVLAEEGALLADADGEPARAVEALRSILRERGTTELRVLHSLAIAAHRAAATDPTAEQWDWVLGCWAAVLHSPGFWEQVEEATGRTVEAAQRDAARDAIGDRIRQDLAAWDASQSVSRDSADAAEVRWGLEWEAARLASGQPGLVAGPRLLDLLAGDGVADAAARRAAWRKDTGAEGAALFGPLGTAHHLLGRGRPEAAAAVLRVQADEQVPGAGELLAMTLLAVAREHHRHREWAQVLGVLAESGERTAETAELAAAAGVNAAREWLHDHIDDQKGAVDLLERAHHLAPDDAGLRENLAAAYLQFGRKVNNEQKDYARAVDLMRKARSLTAEPGGMDKEFVAVLGNLAWQRLGDGEPTRRQLTLAAPLFAQIAAISGAEADLLNAAGVYARLAHASADAGHRDQAVQAMMRSLDHDPEWDGRDRQAAAKTRLSRFFRYKLVENPDASFKAKRAWLNKAAEYDEEDTASAYGLLLHNEGVAQAERKKFPQAVDLLRQSLERTGDTLTRQQLAQVLAAWAVDHANQGDWAAAHRHITDALRHDPRDFHIRLLADQIETGLRRYQRW